MFLCYLFFVCKEMKNLDSFVLPEKTASSDLIVHLHHTGLESVVGENTLPQVS